MTQLLNLALVPLLAHAGLALAIGLGACLNALALLIGLLRRGVYRPAPGWTRFALRLLPALAALAGLLAYADGRIDWIALQAHAGLRAAWLGGVLAASGVIYFGLLFLFGFRPETSDAPRVNSRRFATSRKSRLIRRLFVRFVKN